MLYSSGIEGSQDIMYTHNLDDDNYELPKKVGFLNSKFNDFYPTFNKDNSQLFFTSNRDGVYNIYSNQTDNSKGIIEILNNTKSTTEINTVLSSKFDDKCTFINENTMVFTSNREGGYDLYFSIWNNGKWSKPINFGDKINTKL